MGHSMRETLLEVKRKKKLLLHAAKRFSAHTFFRGQRPVRLSTSTPVQYQTLPPPLTMYAHTCQMDCWMFCMRLLRSLTPSVHECDGCSGECIGCMTSENRPHHPNTRRARPA